MTEAGRAGDRPSPPAPFGRLMAGSLPLRERGGRQVGVRGRRLSFAEVELRDESNGKLAARGSGVFVIEQREAKSER